MSNLEIVVDQSYVRHEIALWLQKRNIVYDWRETWKQQKREMNGNINSGGTVFRGWVIHMRFTNKDDRLMFLLKYGEYV